MTCTLRSFDGTESAQTTIIAPRTREELARVIGEHDHLAVRGSGLSYALAGGAADIPTLSMRGLDQVLELDEATRTVRVEAGATIGSLLRHVVQQGFWFPVLPGHPEITVGGCAAFNTHGKTQHDIGQFVDHIVSLTLLHRDHGELRCSRDEHADLFFLTVGGMGLTGWIVEVELRIQPLAGRSLTRRAHPATSLVESVEIMEARDAEDTHLYSWNDGNRRGRHFGRGVVYEEQFTPDDRPVGGKFRKLRPERRGRLLPWSAWNRVTTGVINQAYFQLESRRRPAVLGLLDAAFPINGREGYFHAYGRPGLREYQLIVPRERWADTCTQVSDMIAATGACIPLTSLKLFRGERTHLWFRGDGVCLTLDGPANGRTSALFSRLDELAIDLGAPVNLSKDSRLSAEAAAQIFPGYTDFKRQLLAHDPARRVDSELRRRINV